MNLGLHIHKLKKILPGLKPTHRIHVSLYQQRGEGNYVYTEDVAARIGIDDDSTEKYHLLKNQVETPPVSYDYVGQTQTGESHVAFVRTGQNSFYPIRPPLGTDSKIKTFTAADTAMREWFVNEAKNMISYFDEGADNWWQTDQAKWVFIGMAMLLMLLGGGWYITKVNQGVVESLNAAPSTIALIAHRVNR